MSNPLAMFDITPEQIAEVVRVFYARIRLHPTLGPIFNGHIAAEDWPAHEEKIAGFWRNAILKERCYDGQPMRVHLERGNVHAEHFPVWLAEFDAVVNEVLPENTARAFSTLAHRIGDGLSFGVQSRDQRADQPPTFS